MKLKIATLVCALTMAARAATNDLTGLLQQGLFEEEANRNLDAAISDYQTLAGQFDKDRQTAATAIFRLGECYRKLGKTNEAVAQYQRILRDFADQQTLATLSQQNLTGLGVSTGTPASSSLSADMQVLQQQIVSAQAQLNENEILLKDLKSMNSDNLRKALPSLFPDDQLNGLMKDLDIAQQELINVQSDYSPSHPKYKALDAKVQDLNRKINDRIEGILLGLEAKVNAETAYLDALRARNQNAPPYGLGSANGQNAIYQLRQQLALAQDQLAKDTERLNRLLTNFLPTNSRVVESKREIESDKASLESLEAELQRTEASQGQNTGTPVTDDEQKEIRRIQVMIQDSPDLINSSDTSGQTPLQTAAEKGQLVVARYLLDHGANVDGTARNSGTPLYLAAANGHKAMVELLLARGANVNGSGNANPLFEAVSKDYPEVAGVLLANKADANFVNIGDSENTPLCIAAIKNQTNMAQMLIAHGARVDAKNKDGHTPLFFTACDNSADVAKILLAAGAEIDARDNNNETPLHGAAFYGHSGMISFLMDHGASVDATNIHNATPLLIAVSRAHTECVRVLLEHKADPNHVGTIVDWQWPGGDGRITTWQGQPAFLAVTLKNDEILRLLLNAGANVTAYNGAVLTSAIDENYTPGVQLLLDHGADPNSAPPGNDSPLNQALEEGKDRQIVKFLLAKGADANAPNRNGLTPLMETTDPEIVRLLIEHKADVNARVATSGPVSGRTALMFNGPVNSDKARILLSHGANPDLQDADGNTALHLAVANRKTNIIAVLLEFKANPNIQSKDGFTPLDIAKAQLQQAQVQAPFAGFNRPNPAAAEAMADMLTKAGALANLPKRDRIEVRRGANFSSTVFTKDAHNWNHFTLLELIATHYGLLSTNGFGNWSSTAQGVRWALWSDDRLPFPDFRNVVIYRPTGNGTTQKTIAVNVADIFDKGDCSRDVPLEWGDVVEIPETDHPVDQKWQGLTEEVFHSLTNCIARQVTLKIKGETNILKLSPEIFSNQYSPLEAFRLLHASFMLRSVLDNSKLIRVSSDLAHVKVTRHDPITDKTQEWTVDCAAWTDAGFWLRDGDVIDVPEK